MAVIYLKHPVHGQKVACSDIEANYDRGNGWVDFDPTVQEAAPAASVPVVPSFLAPIESDLPEDFPGRQALIEGGLATWASVVGKTRDELIAVKGVGPKLADKILDVMES